MTSLNQSGGQQKDYPNRPADETLRVVQITDTHLFATPGERMHEVDTDETLARVLNCIGATETPDLVLATGDLAQDESRAAYRRLADKLAPLGVPVLALAGNHDDPAAMADAFSGTGVDLARQRDIKAWRILQLHSPVAGESWGRLDDAELEWLEQALATDRPVLICLHHPPLATGSDWLDAIGLTNANAFFDVVDRHDSVRAVLAGHVHQQTHARRGAVDYFTTPSTSIQFRPEAAPPAIDAMAPGYRRLQLHPDARVKSEVVRVTRQAA